MTTLNHTNPNSNIQHPHYMERLQHRSFYDENHYPDTEYMTHDIRSGRGAVMAATNNKQDDDMSDEEISTAGRDMSDMPDAHALALQARIDKRKMKRFRLTHSQTRYLMSEFARQAHPDAAQRERLSREIPGLSPRQVQVWFQNRRAKLKRMSSDDRDRMMRSRALPEEFPILQTLQTYDNANTSQLTNHTRSPRIGHLPPHLNGDFIPSTESRTSYPPFPYNSPTTTHEVLSPSSTGGERPQLAYVTTTNMFPRGNPFTLTSPHDNGYRQAIRTTPYQGIPRTIPGTTSTPSQPTPTYNGNILDSPDLQQHGKRTSPSQSERQNINHQSIDPYTPSNSRFPVYPHQPRPLYSPSANSMPVTPLTATSSVFSGVSMSSMGMPQQLSAPPDATTFSTSYLTMNGSAPNTMTRPTSMYSNMDRIDHSIQYGRIHGHRPKRSSSHPPEFAPMNGGSS